MKQSIFSALLISSLLISCASNSSDCGGECAPGESCRSYEGGSYCALVAISLQAAIDRGVDPGTEFYHTEYGRIYFQPDGWYSPEGTLLPLE